MACLYHKLEIVKHLLTEQKEQVDIRACCDRDEKGKGMNGLHLAVKHYDDVDIVEELMKAGCPLDAVDTEVSELQ